MTGFKPLYPQFKTADERTVTLPSGHVLVNQEMETPAGPPELPDLEDFITPSEAARLMQVSRMTVYRRLREGVLKGAKIGRRYLVHVPSLRAQMAPRDLTDEWKEQGK